MKKQQSPCVSKILLCLLIYMHFYMSYIEDLEKLEELGTIYSQVFFFLRCSANKI